MEERIKLCSSVSFMALFSSFLNKGPCILILHRALQIMWLTSIKASV